jgi:hypothetical protein
MVTWGPLSNFEWCMHDLMLGLVVNWSNLITRQSKKLTLSNVNLVAHMIIVWRALIIFPHPTLSHQCFFGQCLTFNNTRKDLMFSKSVIGLPWVSKYLMTTNWTNFLLLYAKSWLTRCWKIELVGIWVVIQYTSTTFDPNIPIDEFNKQAYMFLNLEKEKSHNDSVESSKTTKESLLSTSACSQCHPKKNF